MTEADWLESGDPDAMLVYLEGRISERKLRLFACACCDRIWRLITDEHCRKAVETAERFADGEVSEEALKTAYTAAQKSRPLFADANWAAAWTAAPSVLQAAAEAANQVARSVVPILAQDARAAGWAAVRAGAPEQARSEAWGRFDAENTSVLTAMRHDHAALLREIAGNPFRPVEVPGYWPSPIPQIAEALYGGEDCAFALHDALEESGFSPLAEHYCEPGQWHPRGCWVADLILGRK